MTTLLDAFPQGDFSGIVGPIGEAYTYMLNRTDPNNLTIDVTKPGASSPSYSISQDVNDRFFCSCPVKGTCKHLCATVGNGGFVGLLAILEARHAAAPAGSAAGMNGIIKMLRQQVSEYIPAAGARKKKPTRSRRTGVKATSRSSLPDGSQRRRQDSDKKRKKARSQSARQGVDYLADQLDAMGGRGVTYNWKAAERNARADARAAQRAPLSDQMAGLGGSSLGSVLAPPTFVLPTDPDNLSLSGMSFRSGIAPSTFQGGTSLGGPALQFSRNGFGSRRKRRKRRKRRSRRKRCKSHQRRRRRSPRRCVNVRKKGGRSRRKRNRRKRSARCTRRSR